MKKIININLSGRVIPIEDTAYEKLQAYMESLRRYFSNEEGRDEIINDIESRIAELMSDKVRKGAPCITDADIEEIITSMGRPEDFDAETSETSEAGHTETKKEFFPPKGKGRLYRDTSDKFIAGVCSGIANYLNTDPAIVRILFAIVSFGGGLGFLLYAILWIVLPTRHLEHYSGKRMYRNPDDRIIGGVAGGLAAYFNVKATTLRLIMAAPLILSLFISLVNGLLWNHHFHFFPNLIFGSLNGTFILAYMILWIFLPEANTSYEKMEMRGEKVDVNRIRQNVKEGMDNVKEKMKDWSEEVKESAQQFGQKAQEFADGRGKDFAAEFRETARNSGKGIGYVIGVIVKAFLLFIAGTIAFSLFVSLIAFALGGVAWWPLNDFIWSSQWQQIYTWGTVIFFIAIPLIGFIIWLIRRILQLKKSPYLGWTFSFLWCIGWVCVILLTLNVINEFREYEHSDTLITIPQPANQKLIVAVSQPELEYSGSFGWLNDDDDAEGWNLSEDTLQLSVISFDVKASPDSTYHVTLKKYSFGTTEEEALQRADKIQYSIHVRDSVLDLGNGYGIAKESKLRGQHLEIEIQVPVGKKIRFDESVTDKLSSVSFRMKSTHSRKGSSISVHRSPFRFHTDVDYTMGIDGRLKEAGATKEIPDTDAGPDEDSLELQRSIEQKQQELEELIKEQKKEKEKGSEI